MTLEITVPDQVTAAHRSAILAPLTAYNTAHGGDPRIRPVAIMLTNDGEDVGGLFGRCVYDWLLIELLAVPENTRGRGYGTALIRQAEAIARMHDCIGLCVDTYDFQARGFYEKHGFRVFGTLPDHPVGGSRFFLSKRLDHGKSSVSGASRPAA